MSERFGLLYESTFTGSMVGTSPVVFAVWGYVVACGYGGQVTLNPRLLAPILGTTVAEVEAAVRFHCQPDPDSRSNADEGRRLRHVAGFNYEIVNHDVYRNAKALEERRAYNRAKQRESRERASSTIQVPIIDLSKKSATTADPLVLVSVSSSSGSDPEGVQGEAQPEPVLHERLGDWVVPPELVDEAEREHGIGRDELEHRVARIRIRKIPGEGVSDRTGYVRGLLAEWATWEPPKPKGVRKRPPKGSGPPWLDDGHRALARGGALDLAALAHAFALERRGQRTTVVEARDAFTRYLEQRVRDRSSAAA